jgi:DNA-binding response OmpR family regulator
MPETRKIPVILVTASKDPDLRKKAMELQAAGLFEKPYNAGELLHLAQFVLGDTQPLARPKVVSDQAGPQNAPAARKILIVEDDEKIALALSVRLQSAGYETNTAYDALSAVGAAVEFSPELVLLDISMPAGDGFGVAERLRDLLAKPTPLIFLTASKQPGLREKAAAVGAIDYFEKPFDSERLLASIQRALT